MRTNNFTSMQMHIHCLHNEIDNYKKSITKRATLQMLRSDYINAVFAL